MRRLLLPLWFLVGCAEVQVVRPKPVTCVERCLEDELVCLGGASATVSGILFGIFFVGTSSSGAVVARECEVRTELCKIQKCAPREKVRPARVDPAPEPTDAGVP